MSSPDRSNAAAEASPLGRAVTRGAVFPDRLFGLTGAAGWLLMTGLLVGLVMIAVWALRRILPRQIAVNRLLGPEGHCGRRRRAARHGAMSPRRDGSIFHVRGGGVVVSRAVHDLRCSGAELRREQDPRGSRGRVAAGPSLSPGMVYHVRRPANWSCGRRCGGSWARSCTTSANTRARSGCTTSHRGLPWYARFLAGTVAALVMIRRRNLPLGQVAGLADGAARARLRHRSARLPSGRRRAYGKPSGAAVGDVIPVRDGADECAGASANRATPEPSRYAANTSTGWARCPSHHNSPASANANNASSSGVGSTSCSRRGLGQFIPRRERNL